MRLISALLFLLLPITTFGQAGSDLHSNAGTAAWITDSGVPMSIGTGGANSTCIFSNGQSRWCVNSNGDLVGALTKRLRFTQGTNGVMGRATLSNGAVTVSSNLITTSSQVFLSVQSVSGVPGTLTKANVSAGVSFDIVSSSAGDNSVVAYIIFEPG